MITKGTHAMINNYGNDDEFTLNNPQASMLQEDDEPLLNLDSYRQDAGGTITNDNGLADKLLQNNKIYRAYKGDWMREGWNKGNNIKVTTGREDGKFYIKREQFNIEAIADRCQRYREAAERGIPDPLAPLADDGGLAWRWMELPDIFAIRISDDYFGGMPWQAIKRDRTLKAQFYKVVQQEYPQFICYPGGKLPIPVDVAYPAKVGQQKFFRGM